jgi:hypothetical protein
VPRTLLAGVADSPRRSKLLKLLKLLAAWTPLLGAQVEPAHVRSPSATELYVTGTAGQLALDRPGLNQLARQLRADGVPATPLVLPGSVLVAGLLTLADRVAPPALLAVDPITPTIASTTTWLPAHPRVTLWPVLATLGT